MQYAIRIRSFRSAAVAVAAVSAALSVAACRPGADVAGTGPSAGGTPPAATSPGDPAHGAPAHGLPATHGTPTHGTPTHGTPTHGAPASSRPPSGPSGPSGSSAPSGTPGATAPDTAASPSSARPGGPAPVCAATQLEASARQAADRPAGTGTGAAVVAFTNVSGRTCVLRGHPTVAGAGNGSPQHGVPLTVTRAGAARPVRLAPGATAWLKLTFVQVQGEADGYCASGATPVAYPTLVVGLPGAGRHQVALDDGLFAECDNKVTATAVSAVEPS
ncbi:DUF4232 domain-containing protein [Streptomyces sp. NPDC003374]